MALVLKDRVLETCMAPGTGSATLLGAPTGYQTFNAAIGDGNTCYYTIADQAGANWEVGIGTYTASGTVLARTTVLSSSNSGSLVNFNAGTQNVFATYPAEKAVYLDASGNVNPTTFASLTTGSVTFSDTSVQSTAASGFGFKNRIINGAMATDQRNNGASITNTAGFSNLYSVDRWGYQASAASKFSMQRNAGSVTPPAGFTNYLGVTSLSAYTAAAGEYFVFYQAIEGLNAGDLAWGTASAVTITISFYVYASAAGTYSGALANSAGSRSYPFNFSIASANTWQRVSVTIAGDTGGSGTWLTTNGIGVYVRIDLGSYAATYKGPAGAWAAANYNGATGSINVIGTSGAYIYVTGVQFERGSTATAFDVRPYGTELALCQRYYETGVATLYGYGSSTVDTLRTSMRFAVPKRAAPATIVFSGGTFGNSSLANTTAPTISTDRFDMRVLSTNVSLAAVSADSVTWTAASEL